MSSFNTQQNIHASLLYVVVFSSRMVAAMVLVLVFSLLLQPVEQAFADEVTSPAAEDLASTITPVKVESVTTQSIDNSLSAEAEIESNVSNSETEVTNKIIQEESEVLVETDTAVSATSPEHTLATATNSVTKPKASTTEFASTPPQSVQTGTSTSSAQVISSTTTASTSSSVEISSSQADQDQALDQDDDSIATHVEDQSSDALTFDPEISEQNLQNLSENMSSTSTQSEDVEAEEDVQTINEESVHISDENRYQFSRQDCIEVGDGAYYCSEITEAKTYIEDGVYAAPDKDGDEEIFVRVHGEEVQLTHNTVDDNSPYYDALSNRVVWHQSVNDRYQILSYSLSDNETSQLTSSSYNNMEPVADGDTTLWQAWIGNNWEIMMHDGQDTFQLTSNDMHDVAPHIRGGYIVWQTQFADGWKVAVYNDATKKIDYIDSEQGFGMAENPRFVLVFDQVDGNGDVKTLGYDFDTKSTIHLGSIPQELPEELPEPEQTGETRALVQSKPSGKEGDEDGPVINPNALPNNDAATNNATSTTAISTVSDLVITKNNDTTNESMATSSVGVVTDDVSNDNNVASTSLDISSEIPDLVIPPIIGSSTEETS